METSAARNAGLPIVSKGDVPYIYTSFYEGKSCNKNLFVNASSISASVFIGVKAITRGNPAARQ